MVDIMSLELLGSFEMLILMSMKNDINGSITTNDLHEKLEKDIEKEVSLSSMYVTLSRLHKKGYIGTVGLTETINKRGGKARCLYKIQDKGIRALEESIHPFVKILESTC